MGSPSEFSDRKIPKVCRDCRFCRRYIPVSDWMPSWLPWEYECQSKDGRRYDHENGVEVCSNKEFKDAK